MKLARSRLTRLIKEELGRFLNEAHAGEELTGYWADLPPEEQESEAAAMQSNVERNLASVPMDQYEHLKDKLPPEDVGFHRTKVTHEYLLDKGFEYNEDYQLYYDPAAGLEETLWQLFQHGKAPWGN